MFTIIVPARLFTSTLKETLDKISSQTYKNYEVIVVLDFEEDIKEGWLNTNFIFSGVKSPGEKRNIGIELAKGEFVAFLDDDAYPVDTWLENSKHLFDSNPEYMGVCGPSLTPPESDLLQQIGGHIYESFLNSGPTRYRHLPKSPRLVDDHPTVNLIVKKACLQEVGGFDIKYWPGEDTKLCLDLTKKFGKSIYYSPNLIVFHSRRGVFHPHLIQLSRYAFHRGFFAKMFPETSLRLSYFIPSMFVIYLSFIPFSYLFFGNDVFNIFLFPLYLYFLIMVIETIHIYNKSSSLAKAVLGSIGIFLSNITYGIFFLKGVFSQPNLILREVDIVNEKYIKG